jgi:hypothetical protein
VEEALCPCA